MKKILAFIIEPIKFWGNRGFSDKIVAFFDRFPYLVHLLAFLTTLTILFIKYIVPNL